MVSVFALWLPILLAAVIVFLASSIIHMMLPYHRSDFGAVPKEDEVREALGQFSIAPGDYMIPWAGDPDNWKSPEFLKKMEEGPIAMMTVLPNGPPRMRKNLILWFCYCIVVGLITAYMTGLAAGPGTDYRVVFRLASTAAFTGYGLALLQSSIWYGRSWSTTLKSVFDSLIYGLLTAGTFGWLWPS